MFLFVLHITNLKRSKVVSENANDKATNCILLSMCIYATFTFPINISVSTEIKKFLSCMQKWISNQILVL